jgi:hypothetical protein
MDHHQQQLQMHKVELLLKAQVQTITQEDWKNTIQTFLTDIAEAR